MVDAYNFLGAWQLLPERGIYGIGQRPKNATYRIEAGSERKALKLSRTWLTLEDQALGFTLDVVADGEWQPAPVSDSQATEVRIQFEGSNNFSLALRTSTGTTTVSHDILPNGFLQVVTRQSEDGESPHDVEIYHRQLSVLPYSSTVSGAAVVPNESGIIRHKSLTAMEEQTNMQLQQIRQQIELLALQAQEIQRRKELSQLIYAADLRFEPVVGQTYYLYETKDNVHLLSMIGPKEWGRRGQDLRFLAAVQLLADRTWKEL